MELFLISQLYLEKERLLKEYGVNLQHKLEEEVMIMMNLLETEVKDMVAVEVVEGMGKEEAVALVQIQTKVN